MAEVLKKIFHSWNNRFHFLFFFQLFKIVLALILTCQISYASEVTLAWDSNDQASGYMLYYGSESGNYENMIDVGNILQYTVPNLSENQLYYFAVTAYNEFGESGFSDEISFGTAVNIGNIPPTADAVGDPNAGVNSDPIPKILVNSFAGSFSTRLGTDLSITVELDSSDYTGEAADWWVFARTPDGDWFYFDYQFSEWHYAGSLNYISPSYQGPLNDLAPLELCVIDTSNLIEGEYTFYFATDLIMNKSLDYNVWYIDSVQIILIP